MCPGPTWVSSGRYSRHSFMAWLQRAAKGQPTGGFNRSGGVPKMGTSFYRLRVGLEASSPAE